jgi:hypothetical protein
MWSNIIPIYPVATKNCTYLKASYRVRVRNAKFGTTLVLPKFSMSVGLVILEKARAGSKTLGFVETVASASAMCKAIFDPMQMRPGAWLLQISPT